MSSYLGEIRMFAGTFAPAGWEFCDGQTLPISENEPLFQLIGTTYGGDGEQTFNLPDLRGRVPLHQGTNNGVTFTLAQAAGVESVTLTTQQIPIHTHPLLASTDFATQANPGGALTAQPSVAALYFPTAPTQPLAPSLLSPAGGSQPHENMQPFLCINFIISMFGPFPSQT